MRVGIVGATGLIGRRLVADLAERGDEVVPLVRRESDLPGTRQIVWDGVGALPDGAFTGCDAVINIAGSPIGRRWNDDIKREIVSSRVDLTARVVEALGRDKVPVLVNASAVGYYGDREAEADETAPQGRGFLADVCARWEAAARGAQTHGARVVMTRTGIVLSTDGGALPQMVTPTKAGLGGPIAGGKQWFPWVHIDDVAGVVLRALDDATINGPINVVSPGIVRQGEFARALGHAVHRPAVTPTPKLALRVMLGEGAQIITEGQHAVPRAALAAGYAFRHDTAAGALADLLG